MPDFLFQFIYGFRLGFFSLLFFRRFFNLFRHGLFHKKKYRNESIPACAESQKAEVAKKF